MRFSSFILLLFPVISVAQTGCPTLYVSYSYHCGDDSVALFAASGFDVYAWSPATGLSDPNVQNPLAATGSGITYTVTASSFSGGTELVVNGDMSSGNSGFTSGQTYSTTYSPCNYYVASQWFGSMFPFITDHTPTADNMYMSVDGCSSGPTVLWEETIPVIDPGTTYNFTFWATKADQVQPIFEMHMIGNVTGDVIENVYTGLPYMGVNAWDQYGITGWNSGANASVTIRIINNETNGYGNDFGLDDFSFHGTCTKSTIIRIPDAGNVSETIVPNVFTPNADGENDLFRFADMTVKSCKIYDRWGLLMKELTEQDAVWDGKNRKSAACPDGVYFYILEGENSCGQQVNTSGFVQLVR
jgi:gliding motility-associated-like protein